MQRKRTQERKMTGHMRRYRVGVSLSAQASLPQLILSTNSDSDGTRLDRYKVFSASLESIYSTRIEMYSEYHSGSACRTELRRTTGNSGEALDLIWS